MVSILVHGRSAGEACCASSVVVAAAAAAADKIVAHHRGCVDSHAAPALPAELAGRAAGPPVTAELAVHAEHTGPSVLAEPRQDVAKAGWVEEEQTGAGRGDQGTPNLHKE